MYTIHVNIIQPCLPAFLNNYYIPKVAPAEHFDYTHSSDGNRNGNHIYATKNPIQVVKLTYEICPVKYAIYVGGPLVRNGIKEEEEEGLPFTLK